MKLALFDDYRLGVVSADERTIADISVAAPDLHADDPFGAGWWVRLCRDFAARRGEIAAAAGDAPKHPLAHVRLRAPALNPTKIVAAAVNYEAHVTEMRDVVLPRVSRTADAKLLQFDIFLKAPSALGGPADPVVIPSGELVDGKEIHHESELTLVIGKRATRVPRDRAFEYILGYTIALDITVRGDGDRTRRKSYDTFCPLGPWVTTADEIADPTTLEITLAVDGARRQHVRAGEMKVDIPGLVEYASHAMTLEPGDLLLTGAPPGVGKILPGEVMHAAISSLGSMDISVVAQ